MSSDISPENEQFIASAVSRGDFRDRFEVLNAGVELLKRKQEYCDDIAAGTRQLEQGQFRDYDRNTLQSLFDQIKAEGRRLLAAQQSSR